MQTRWSPTIGYAEKHSDIRDWSIMIKRLASFLALLTLITIPFTAAGCASNAPEKSDIMVTIKDGNQLIPDRHEVRLPKSPAVIVVYATNERTSGTASNLTYRVTFAPITTDGREIAGQDRPFLSVNANSQDRHKHLEFKAGTYKLLSQNDPFADEIPSPDGATVTFIVS